MIEVTLTNSQAVALIDDEDWDLCMFEWHEINGYVRCCSAINERFMHRIIGLRLKFTDEVDHIDNNPLNNIRSNLRNATRKQNGSNRLKQNKRTWSKYKGVSFHRYGNRWIAAIKYNGILINLGSYKIEKEAAIAYNKAAIIYHKEFAKLNIIED